MKVLFVDNFRGFSRTTIPIEDVNFLVGENSTGKTSILGLLRIIATSEFWFKFDFSMEDGIFGHFKDIVSISAKDKSYFSFGIINTNNDAGDKSCDAQFCVFNEKDGMPKLAFYAYIIDKQLIKVRITNRQIRYKQEEINTDLNEFNASESIFNSLALDYKDDKTGYKNFSPKTAFGLPSTIAAQSPGLAIGLVRQYLLRGNEDSKNKKDHISSSIFLGQPFFYDFAWLAPIRTQPRRTYDEYKLDFTPEGSHTPYLIKKILEKKSEAKEFKLFLGKVGKDSGLFDSVEIKNYGKSATSPFELDVILNKHALSINNVGYGVSQSLPVIVEVFTRSVGCWFAIQQPEVHLHPKAQAALGDIFFELSQREKKKFIIETHSDYTIDRFRINYRRKNKKNLPTSNILFFERNSKGNKVYVINIDKDGNVSDKQPKGYRQFFVKEDIKLLGL